LTVYYTQGSPEATRRRDYSIGFGPYTAVIADLDGDKNPDVAVVNFQANDGRDLSILWGTGNTQEPLAPAVHLAMQGAPFAYDKSRYANGSPVYPTPGLTSIAALDANRDGRLDLAVVAWSSDFFAVLVNEGRRRFRQVRYPLPPGPRDVAVADFNGDGRADLAFTIYSANLVEIWAGTANGGFQRSETLLSQGAIPYHLKAGDLNQDGRPDLVVGNRGPSDNGAVFLNENGRFRWIGSFQPGTPKKGEMTADEIRDVLLADFDQDGILDLAAACHVSHKLVTWRGTGKTGFGESFTGRQVREYPGKGPRSVTYTGGQLWLALFDSNEWITLAPR
jgi:hypothetical protein